MARSRVRTSPPSVGVSNNQKKPSGEKVVGTNGKPLRSDPTPPTEDEVPALDPRLSCMGQFAIPQSHVRAKLDEIMEFMRDVVIVRCELIYMPQGSVFMYTGISQKYFQPIPDGVQAPLYDIARRLDGVFVVRPAMRPTAPPPPGKQ